MAKYKYFLVEKRKETSSGGVICLICFIIMIVGLTSSNTTFSTIAYVLLGLMGASIIIGLIFWFKKHRLQQQLQQQQLQQQQQQQGQPQQPISVIISTSPQYDPAKITPNFGQPSNYFNQETPNIMMIQQQQQPQQQPEILPWLMPQQQSPSKYDLTPPPPY